MPSDGQVFAHETESTLLENNTFLVSSLLGQDAGTGRGMGFASQGLMSSLTCLSNDIAVTIVHSMLLLYLAMHTPR